MLRVFVSYSRKNQVATEQIIQDLEALGHEVWFDQELTGGQTWWDQVLAQIRGCELFLLVIAPETLSSQACKLEYTYAFNLGKNILPVLVAEGVSINLLPPALSALQFVDFRKQDKAAALALGKALYDLPVSGPLPDPLPDSPSVPISYLGNLKDQIESDRTLPFEEQTALLFKLKDLLRDAETGADARALLGLLRKRDDLLAKIAAEIDVLEANKPTHDTVRTEASPKNKKPKREEKKNEDVAVPSDWRAKVLSKGWTERSIKVYLTEEEHLIEFRRRHWKLWNNWEACVDGEVVVKGAHDFTDKAKLSFRVRDGSKTYPATIEAAMTGMERLRRLTLRIGNKLLYEEAE